MLLITGHILLVIGLYLFAWGIKIPLPPGTDWKKAALHALWPTFGGLLIIGASGCMLYGATFLGKGWFS